MSSVRILIVDDHPAVRAGLRQLISSRPGWLICGEATDGAEAVSQAMQLKPSAIVMDISMPRMDGLEATRRIREQLPSTEILIVSQHDSEQVVREAQRAGARGFVLKSHLSADLLPALESALLHSSRISAPVSKAWHDAISDLKSPANGALTDPGPHDDLDLMSGGGEMGALMRSYDWSKTPFGAVSAWPQSLRTALRICLDSRFPIVIWWGPELRLLYNDAWRPALGTTKDPQALGAPGKEVWADVWDTIGPMLESVMRTGKATWENDQLLLFDRHGYVEETYWTYSYSAIRLASGEVGGVFSAVHEVTDRVINARRLKTLREVADQVVQAKNEVDACTLAMQSIVRNPADCPYAMIFLCAGKKARRVGASFDGHAGVPSILDLEEEDTWAVQKAVQMGTSQIVEVQNGEAMPAAPFGDKCKQAISIPILGTTREPIAVITIGISPYRALDTAYRDFLESLARNLAANINNARAYDEERKRAEALAELDRAKTVFFSNVSHEFRTPLTLMLAPLEDMLSESKGLNPDQQERLNIAHRNSLRLLKLVNTLLDFSRIEAGRLEACYEPTNLPELTSELASVFRSAIERAGLRLIVNCEEVGEPVYVDREMWEKIVFNLLSNGLKFTFSGEMEVSVKRANDKVELAVRDTGTGIPAQHLPRLFERFYRVQGVHGRTFEGSGIGLALVQELAKLHGGTVRVESRENCGSTFTVAIPLGKNHLPVERIGAARTLVPTGTQGEAYVQEALRWLPEHQYIPNEIPVESLSQPKMPASAGTGRLSRVLFAEDNTDMREYVQRLLQHQYKVIAVADGKAALESARQTHPDLVLADVMMPRLDGFGLLRELRADHDLRGIPVILLSARAGEESRVEGLSAGADDYLVKPFSARELLARVSSHLALAKVRREAAELERELRAEAELERSRLHELFMQAPAAIGFLSGPEHRFTFVNHDYVKLTGRRKAEDFVGMGVREAFPEVEGQGLLELLDNVYQTGVPYIGKERKVILNRGPNAQPEDVYLDFIYQPMRRANSDVEGIFVHAVDVTQQVLARKEIERREQQFREMFDALPAAIYTTDAQGRLTHYNPAAVRFSGHTPELGTDQWCVSWKLYYPDGRPMPHDECPMAIALKEGRIIEGAEAIAERPDGTRRWFTPYSTPIRDRRGNIVGGINMLVDITERREAEQITSLLASIVDSSDDAIISKKLDGTITSWNKSAEKLFGYTAQEAIGQHITLIVPWERRSEEEDILRRLARGERIDHFETVRRRKDGATFDVSLTISPIRDAGGKVIGASNVARDISERKRIERALRESEERFRAIVETTPECVKLVSADGTLLHMNSPGLQMVGAHSAEEVVGKNLYELIAPDDRDRFKAFNESICRGEHGSLQFDIVGLEGKRRHMETHAAPLRNTDGTMVHLAVTSDISQRKQAEQALRESEQRYRAITEATPIMVWMASLDKLCYYFNKGWLDFVGRTLEQESGNGWAENVHPDDFDRCLQIYVSSFDARRPFEMQYRLRHHSGQYRWILDSAVPRYAPDGSFEGYVGGCLDIHGQKEAEEKARRADVSFQLLKGQDEERRHIARELHDSAGQTLTVLGIDVAQLSQEAARSAPMLAEKIDRIQETIQQLHTEIRTTSYLLHPPMLDESGLYSAVSWYVKGLQERSGLEVRLDISEDFGRLPRDMELLIFRLVQECLTNIHRHSDSKTAAIRIARSSNQITLDIQDQGKGMSPPRLAEVQSGRSGLGIRGMRERLRQFEGTIDIESDSAGTRVVATVPIPRAALQENQDKA